jgi:hypothetical protein
MNIDSEYEEIEGDRSLDLEDSFEFGDKVPEIQLKFREAIDENHETDRLIRYILNIDNLYLREL